MCIRDRERTVSNSFQKIQASRTTSRASIQVRGLGRGNVCAHGERPAESIAGDHHKSCELCDMGVGSCADTEAAAKAGNCSSCASDGEYATGRRQSRRWNICTLPQWYKPKGSRVRPSYCAGASLSPFPALQREGQDGAVHYSNPVRKGERQDPGWWFESQHGLDVLVSSTRGGMYSAMFEGCFSLLGTLSLEVS